MKEKDKKYYAGIGSRKTPESILRLMSSIAEYLSNQGYILRSGGAEGADKAFEQGCKGDKEIFIPWNGFNNLSQLYPLTKECFELASQFHPVWDKLSQGAKKLHARNCQQILGKDLNNPVDFVICWTKNGKEVGGTAQAIRVAKSKKIRIFNLGILEDKSYWCDLIKYNYES